MFTWNCLGTSEGEYSLNVLYFLLYIVDQKYKLLTSDLHLVNITESWMTIYCLPLEQYLFYYLRGMQ